MKRILLSLLLLSLCCCLSVNAQKNKSSMYHHGWIDFNKNGKMDVFEDPSQPIDKRIQDLLSQMTPEEKTCQLATLYGTGRVLKDWQPTPDWKNQIWKDGIANIDEELNGIVSTFKFYSNEYTFPYSNHAKSINNIQRWFVEETRLGIPVDFTNEGIHGLNHDRATPLPAPIAIASTWNKDLVYEAGHIVGKEAKVLGYTNVYTPILDVSRDQRWGRVVETYGEDPFLIAALGTQMVKGVQEEGVASTVKHYAVYSMPKGGRDGNARTDPHVAPREMHQLYLYPFKKVIQEAHPMGVMSSYNDWDGVPVSGSYYFLTILLRQQFGFRGYIVSDSEAVEYLYTKHHVADTYEEAVRQVVEAGLNVRTNFTPPADYILPLRNLIKEGKVSMATLDSRVADVLRVKFELGLFDHPYVENPKVADQIVGPDKHENFIRSMARESIVLLKNDNHTLPFDLPRLKNVLVTGPLATETGFLSSRYGPVNIKGTSVLDGIRQYVGAKATVAYAKGCSLIDATWPESAILPTPLDADEKSLMDSAVLKAKDADVIVAVMGQNEHLTGECRSQTSLDLPGKQDLFLKALKDTGKPVVLILVNGQPLTINWANRYVDGILETWFSNSDFGHAVAETLFGDNNPGGRLPITFPKTVGQIELNFPYKPASQADEGKKGSAYGPTQLNGPLYPFGYGLSYTTFDYSNLEVTPSEINPQADVQVSVKITNSGTRKGDEVVQLYLKDEVSSVTTYEYDLRGFERISLAPGESKTVHFVLHPDDMALLDKNMNWTVEPGKFTVMVGSSSADIRLKQEFAVK